MRGAAAERERPTQIGPYRISGIIGAGGMGVVYVGQEDAASTRVAIKTVRMAAESDLAGIRREIHALRALRHRGVVRIVAEGVERGLPWYAMELLEGETLERRLETLWRQASADAPTRLATASLRGLPTLTADSIDIPISEGAPAAPVPPPPTSPAAGGALDEVLALASALCETLSFLHGEGIVHRDLKPANIFLRDGKEPVLVDFGLVARVQSSFGREVLDVFASAAGTPAYMAPEVIQGGVVDARTDLYALGCILYEAVTGGPPFTGLTMHEVLRQHLHAAPLPASARVVGVPPSLDALLGRLLEKRPRDRLGHADDVIAALAELSGAPPSVGRRSMGPGSARRPRAYVYRPELVGRDEVLSSLRDRLRNLLAGTGGFVLVGGESGVGKTHLAMELARAANTLGILVVTGACVALGGAGGADGAAESPNDAPLHPFTPVLQAIADRCLSLGPEVMGEVLGARAKVLAAVEPGLGRLPGHDAFPDPPELAARAAKDRLLRSLRETLAACARRWPLLLILDDLQWADELSMELCASLATASPASFFDDNPVLVLGTYRAEDRGEALGRLLEQPGVGRIDLGRLDEPRVRAMVAGMLALDPPPARFVRFLAERSAGNPFFVAEYVRTAVAEGLLYRTPDGRWQIDAGSDDAYQRLPLPGSLRELVATRLGRLGASARALCEVAAVVGREAPGDLLAEVAGMDEYAGMEALRELTARQVLEDAGGGRLRFLHAKLRETAYEGLPPARRRALHAAAGHAIEARHAGSDAMPLHYAELASHFAQAGEVRAALRYLELAGEQALASFANQEAVHLFRDLLALDARSPETAAERATVAGRTRRARWERRLCEAYYAQGDHDAAREHAKRALLLTGLTAPRTRAGWALSLLRNVPVQAAHRLLPRRPEADDDRRELLREAAASMDQLSESFYFLDAVGMIAGSLWAVNLAERAGGSACVAMPYGMLGLTAGISKLPGLARRYFALAEGAADPRGLVHALTLEGTLRSGEGGWAEARRTLHRALDAARRRGDPSEIRTVETVLGNADHFTGRFREAKRTFLDLADATRSGENPQHLAWGLYGAARSMVPLGEIDEALPLLEAAERVLDPQAELPSRIICFGLSATVHLARGDLPRALALARRTTATIRENMLAAYAIVTGYAGAAEVYLENLRALRRAGAPRAEVREAEAEVARAARDLRLLAFSIPIGRPYHLRFAGRRLAGEGRPDRARLAFTRALAEAQRLGMPHDAALAHRDLGGLEPPGSAAQRAHLDRARALLAELGCDKEKT